MLHLTPRALASAARRAPALLALALLACAPATAPAKPAASTPAPPAAPAASAPAPTSAPAQAAAPAPTVAAAPARMEQVTVLLDWFPDGYHSPFYVARDRGWYREAGLEVEIKEGRGSGNVTQLVGTKNATFGFAEGGAMARGVATGIPVRMVGGVFRSTPLGLASLRATGINTPKDLEGKIYGAVTGSASHNLWPAFVAANGVDESKITIVNIDTQGADAAMLSGRIQFTDAIASGEPVRYAVAGQPGSILLYGDWGLSVVGHGIITHNDTQREKPAMVRSFVQASMRAWDFTRQNPDEAVDIFRKSVPEKSLEVARPALQGTLGLLESESTRGRPLGYQSEADWQSTLDILARTGLQSPPRLDQVFTNEFAPTQ